MGIIRITLGMVTLIIIRILSNMMNDSGIMIGIIIIRSIIMVRIIITRMIRMYIDMHPSYCGSGARTRIPTAVSSHTNTHESNLVGDTKPGEPASSRHLCA